MLIIDTDFIISKFKLAGLRFLTEIMSWIKNIFVSIILKENKTREMKSLGMLSIFMEAKSHFSLCYFPTLYIFAIIITVRNLPALLLRLPKKGA